MLKGSRRRVVKRDNDNCNFHQTSRDSAEISDVNSSSTRIKREIEFAQTTENINFDLFDGSEPKSIAFKTKFKAEKNAAK